MARLTPIVSRWMCSRRNNSASRCAMSPIGHFADNPADPLYVGFARHTGSRHNRLRSSLELRRRDERRASTRRLKAWTWDVPAWTSPQSRGRGARTARGRATEADDRVAVKKIPVARGSCGRGVSLWGCLLEQLLLISQYYFDHTHC
jgi:hypothetical protein